MLIFWYQTTQERAETPTNRCEQWHARVSGIPAHNAFQWSCLTSEGSGFLPITHKPRDVAPPETVQFSGSPIFVLGPDLDLVSAQRTRTVPPRLCWCSQTARTKTATPPEQSAVIDVFSKELSTRRVNVKNHLCAVSQHHGGTSNARVASFPKRHLNLVHKKNYNAIKSQKPKKFDSYKNILWMQESFIFYSKCIE